AADNEVPFKGDAKLTLTSSSVDGMGNTHLTYVGTGQGTHLGRFTEDANLVVHADGSFTANVVLTAANGDKVYKGVTEGSISRNFAAGKVTVLGGTGRFVDATGEGDVEMVLSDGITHAAQAYEGTIEF